MQSFTSAIDCLVSPHRSEGFGLAIAEAMLAEKPVIVTGFSGDKDFTAAETVISSIPGLARSAGLRALSSPFVVGRAAKARARAPTSSPSTTSTRSPARFGTASTNSSFSRPCRASSRLGAGTSRADRALSRRKHALHNHHRRRRY